jgi:hypothetical protein
MAKSTKSISFKNAVISKDDMKITEYMKDETKSYSLLNLIEEWDGVEGISLTIKQDNDIPSDE